MAVLKRTLDDMGIGDAIGADQDGYPWIFGYRGPALSELASARVDRPLWLRSLVRKPDFGPRPWAIWQVSNFRSLHGIEGWVDWNVARPASQISMQQRAKKRRPSPKN